MHLNLCCKICLRQGLLQWSLWQKIRFQLSLSRSLHRLGKQQQRLQALRSPRKKNPIKTGITVLLCLSRKSFQLLTKLNLNCLQVFKKLPIFYCFARRFNCPATNSCCSFFNPTQIGMFISDRHAFAETGRSLSL